MFVKKTLAAAGLLAITGAVAACGGGSSSAPTASGAAGAPSGATTTEFCGTFQKMVSSTTPKQAADQLLAVGTPSGIASDARHGFEVLVDHLETLPDNAKSADLTAMEKGLSATDQKDVVAFTTYLTQACVPSTASTPSAPSS